MEQTTINHTHGHAHAIDPVEEYKQSKFGMWLFLGTEILLFGGLFAAYAIFRAKYPEMFHHEHQELNWQLGAVNTVILIFSSMTMAMGVTASKKGNNKLLIIMLAITILCGLGFGVNKYIEYGAKFAHHIYPNTSIFFSLYFMMTGLHMLHVLVGVLVLSAVMILAIMGKFSKSYNTPVEVGGLYWHLVDLIWIYLFPLLYLIG
jgi:cytochrome c oxidase subunit III